MEMYTEIYGFDNNTLKVLDRRFYQLVKAEWKNTPDSSSTKSRRSSTSGEEDPEFGNTFNTETIWKHAAELLNNPLKDVFVLALTTCELPINAYCNRKNQNFDNPNKIGDVVNFERFLNVMSIFLKPKVAFLDHPQRNQKLQELAEKKSKFLFNMYTHHQEAFISKAGLAKAAAHVMGGSKRVQDVVSEVWHEYEKICPDDATRTPERIYIESFETMVKLGETGKCVIQSLEIDFWFLQKSDTHKSN